MPFKNIHVFILLLSSVLITILSTSSSMGNLSSSACSGCHGFGTSSNGSLTIMGLPTAYQHGATYDIQVCLVDPSKFAAGFRLEAAIGTLSGGMDTNVSGVGDKITHSFPKPFMTPGNPACWDIDWVAPSSGNDLASFNAYGNAVNSNGNPTGDNGGYTAQSTNIALPVVWGSFNVFAEHKQVVIEWETLQEINTSHYEIEKSDNALDFYPMAKLDAMHEASSYTYVDRSADEGLRYYRIKQVDADGLYEYTPVKSIELESSIYSQFYPNPAQDVLFFPSEVEGHVVEIYTLTGSLVYKTEVQNGSIEISNLSPASYYVNIVGSKNRSQLVVVH